MKLKKIASLALAGLMAVSMLAGYGNNANSGNNNNNGAVSSSIVDAVNNGQDSYNDVKVTFTADSKLQDAANTVIASYGESLSQQVYTDAIAKIAQYAGIVDYKDAPKSNPFYGDKTGLVSPATAKDGEKVTFLAMVSIGDSSCSNAYMMNFAADSINNLVASLDDTTLVTADDKKNDPNLELTKEDDPYYDFSYTGKVCMVEVPYASGATNYYMVVVLEQTVAEKTL